jgi:hypothetical protein
LLCNFVKKTTLCCAKFVDKLGECWFSILAQSAMPKSDHDEDDEDDEDVDDELLWSHPKTQQGKMLLMKTRKDVILFYYYNNLYYYFKPDMIKKQIISTVL